MARDLDVLADREVVERAARLAALEDADDSEDHRGVPRHQRQRHKLAADLRHALTLAGLDDSVLDLVPPWGSGYCVGALLASNRIAVPRLAQMLDPRRLERPRTLAPAPLAEIRWGRWSSPGADDDSGDREQA